MFVKAKSDLEFYLKSKQVKIKFGGLHDMSHFNLASEVKHTILTTQKPQCQTSGEVHQWIKSPGANDIKN